MATGKPIAPVAPQIAVAVATGEESNIDSDNDIQIEREVENVELYSDCPNTVIHVQGVPVRALIDTGSQVTTVTETWAKQYMAQTPKENCHLTLRAVNGAEVPYSGVCVVDIVMYGTLCSNVPVLVVKDPTDPATLLRKTRMPFLLGINVLGPVAQSAQYLPPILQPLVKEPESQVKM